MPLSDLIALAESTATACVAARSIIGEEQLAIMIAYSAIENMGLRVNAAEAARILGEKNAPHSTVAEWLKKLREAKTYDT